jgi:ornithine cyclodeaminase
VRPIERVSVWARRTDQAQALARDWCAAGWDAQAVTDLPSACAEADVVSCATMAQEPLIHGAWLPEGVHLDLIGGFTPNMREADDACFEQARLMVDTEEALLKSGDLPSDSLRGSRTGRGSSSWPGREAPRTARRSSRGRRTRVPQTRSKGCV